MARTAKAALCRAHNTPVVIEPVTVDGPKRGEVMVKLGACGVCHSDLSAITGTIALPLPLVLGHEGAGVVEEAGEGVSGLRRAITSSSPSSICAADAASASRGGRCCASSRALTTPLEGTPRVRDARRAAQHLLGMRLDGRVCDGVGREPDQDRPQDSARLRRAGRLWGDHGRRCSLQRRKSSPARRSRCSAAAASGSR